MSYSGGDGQSLGIVLTPKHICNLFCELIDLKPDDTVLDPCCGTAGFLVSAMHYMLKKTSSEHERISIKRNQLHGYELQPYMFTIATTNMILRGDGKSNLICDDFLVQDANRLQLKGATVGMMNPPYSMGKVSPEKCELSFTEHLLDSLVKGGKAIVIIPQSAVTGKNKYEQGIKKSILKHHTLEGVITLNTNTFYGVGTNPCIAIFTAGIPHNEEKICKFIDFSDDGYEVQKHRGLVETERAKDRKQHLLDVWYNRIEASTKFCVETTVKASDEWLHSFYYFNDEVPAREKFKDCIADYLTFEFGIIMHNHTHILSRNTNNSLCKITEMSCKEWKPFILDEIFDIKSTSSGIDKNKLIKGDGIYPYITRTDQNNGIDSFICEQDRKYSRDNKNVITIGLDTQTAFYQPIEFYTGQNIQIIYNENLNYYSAMFLIPILKQLMEKFSWGSNGATLTRLRRSKIYLPVNENKEPDYEYMSKYISNLEIEMLEQYKNYMDLLKD